MTNVDEKLLGRFCEMGSPLADRQRLQRHSTPRPSAACLGVSVLLAVGDALIIVQAGLATLSFHVAWEAIGFEYVATILSAALSTVLMCDRFGLYHLRSVIRYAGNAHRVAGCWTSIAFLLMGSAFVLHLSDHYFSRLWTVWWFIVGLLALWLWRAGMGWLILHMSAAGRLALKVALIGPSAYCRPVITKLLQTDPQVQVLGIFDDSRLHSSPASPDHDVSGSINDLLEIVRARQVDRIIVAVPWSAGERVPQIIAYFEGVAIDIDLALEGILSRNTGSLQYRPQDDIPTLSIANPPLATWRLAIKVLEDKILAALILLLLAPLMVAIAVAIRVSSPGSSIFRQIRLGFNNDTIEVYKFRTMYDHLRDDQAIQPVKHGDARVTPLGKFLRKFSLDELPQLFNVLRGDMSLVGPRPHVLAAKVSDCLFSEVVASYAARHRVRPGMTGWAQVNGWRGEADTIEKVEHRVRCDLYYINNWSLLLDFKILALTIPAVVWPRNAY